MHLISSTKKVRTKHGGAVDASVWFDHPAATGFGVEEHSIRIRQGNVLSLLWWKDEDMLIKIEEFEDKRAARRSDSRLERIDRRTPSFSIFLVCLLPPSQLL